MPIDFLTDFEPEYGRAVPVTPLVRRVVCDNPGRFTFAGTGTYIVGRGQVAVIDPGPDDEDHLAALLAAVAGEEVTHILVTHTHRDHSPGARALQTETGALSVGFGSHPVSPTDQRERAKPTTWQALEPTEEELAELRRSQPKRTRSAHADQEEPGDVAFAPDIELGHGDVLAGGNWTIESLHTPGHISNHLCYALREERSLFTGDHVMGWSTSVIPSPEGSMADYMASLELLLGRDDTQYYPTHGPPIPEPQTFTRALIDHRLDRERQILECLRSGPKTVPEMVTSMYRATPHILHMAAGQSVFSHLVRMHAAGRVVTHDPEPTADSVYETGATPRR